MGFDIRTFAIILGITHLIQVIVFLQQYRMNKVYQGIGWWLMWSATEVIGFAFIVLRGIPSIQSMAIIGQNTMIVLGTLFLYIGVMRFLDKKENRRVVYALFALFSAGLLYFNYVNNDYAVRSVIVCATLAGISFFTAHGLFYYKPPSIAASANFNSVVFLVHGVIFTYRAVMIGAGTPAEDFFSHSLFNAIPYLDALVVSLLWTFGFIIMLNQRLNADMTEAKEHFEKIFSTSPDGSLITSLNDGIILDINGGFTAITGFTREDTIGKSSVDIRLWKNPDDRRKVVNELRDKGSCENFESVFLRKDGGEITGLMSAKIISLRGNPHIISVTRDITERKRGEENLKFLLKEKELLVREVHHRVKNNFTVVSSLLGLQSQQIEDETIQDMFMKSRDRIKSMSLIHERLYQSRDLTHINLAEYLQTLIDDLFHAYRTDPSRVSLVVEAEDVPLNVDQAIPCGLIVNELISNALKYAFPRGWAGEGRIHVTLRRIDGNEIELSVKDNGAGLPDDFDMRKTKSLGLKIITLLAKDQLGGKLMIDRNEGTGFRVRFDVEK